MRVVLFGATDLSCECAEMIVGSGCELTAIVTLPREFSISYSDNKIVNVRHRSFGEFASKNCVALIEMTGNMSGVVESVSGHSPDCILVAGWYHKIPRAIRDLPPKGCLGLHASLLPKYRGGAPLVWAMINEEKETGVSLFHLDDGIDCGDIVGQETFAIKVSDDISDLITKASKASVRLLNKYLSMISAGNAPRFKQDDSKATVFPQRTPRDGLIDLSWPSSKISAFIRAQTKPYPGAYTEINGKRIKIWDAQIEDLK